ncbi:MAG TPA: TIGR02206 family membrane protein [Bryobacteraceae bacterium]|nr:TIGR02206 family membrane protein [Bryobacteraceae bacterium]
MRLFGPLHLSLILATVAIVAALSILCRRNSDAARPVRLALSYGLAANEIVWWIFRYSREGIQLVNLPLQLCDATVWLSAASCLTLQPFVVEVAYFTGVAGAGMAVLTPDLWSPWPSYPAIYFFVAHGGIVAASSVPVFGGMAMLRRGAWWRAFLALLAYAGAVGAVNWLTGANYMFLRAKPESGSLLDALGPWPVYLLPAAALTLLLFWLMYRPLKKAKS